MSGRHRGARPSCWFCDRKVWGARAVHRDGAVAHLACLLIELDAPISDWTGGGWAWGRKNPRGTGTASGPRFPGAPEIPGQAGDL